VSANLNYNVLASLSPGFRP